MNLGFTPDGQRFLSSPLCPKQFWVQPVSLPVFIGAAFPRVNQLELQADC